MITTSRLLCAWLTACKAAGAQHRIPHDFRRTAVRSRERAGVPWSAKNVLEQPTITLGAKGARWTGRARPITNRAKVRAVVKRFRAKHGAADVKKYYSKFDVALVVSPRRARVARSPRRRGATRR